MRVLALTSKDEGYILILYVSMMAFALIIFVAIYMRFQEKQIWQLEREISSIKAFYIAQAGLRKSANSDGAALTENFGGGQFKVAKSNDILYSIGTHKGISRTLRAAIDIPIKDTVKIYFTSAFEMNKSSTIGEWDSNNIAKGGNAVSFNEAVYIHSDFHLAKIPGEICSSTTNPVKCGAIISTAQRNLYDISFYKNNIKVEARPLESNDNQKYIDEWNAIKREVRTDPIYRDLRNNNNDEGIIAHTAANKNRVISIKNNSGSEVATYKYNSNGTILTLAILTIKANREFTLPKGIYYLTELYLQEGATLTGPGNDPLIEIIGFNDDTGATKTINFDQYAKFCGTLKAPYWVFSLNNGGVKIKGALFVHDFQLYNSVTYPPPRWHIEYGDDSSQEENVKLSDWREIPNE